MAEKKSSKIAEFRKLVEKGVEPYDAGKQVGLTKATVRTQLYRLKKEANDKQ